MDGEWGLAFLMETDGDSVRTPATQYVHQEIPALGPGPGVDATQ